MEKVKIAVFGVEHNVNSYHYIPYSPEIDSLEAVANFLNEHRGEYAEFETLNNECCRLPYFIRENTVRVRINISDISYIDEIDANFVTKEEYAQLLSLVIAQKCVNCARFISEQHCINSICGVLHPDDGRCVRYIEKRREN